jgi:hypothetical protein
VLPLFGQAVPDTPDSRRAYPDLCQIRGRGGPEPLPRHLLGNDRVRRFRRRPTDSEPMLPTGPGSPGTWGGNLGLLDGKSRTVALAGGGWQGRKWRGCVVGSRRVPQGDAWRLLEPPAAGTARAPSLVRGHGPRRSSSHG